MDFCSVNSELLESLDFLRPPVKRDFENTDIARTYSNFFNRQPKNTQLLNDVQQTLKKHLIPPKINKTEVQSSTSLILKKTSERKLFEQYSIVSYSNLLRSNKNLFTNNNFKKNPANTEKPLIKVTIIPKAEQVSTARLHRRHNNGLKKIHSTASNQENSIQTKNLYLVVAGRKKEKVYEIRATGSAKLFNEQTTNHSKDVEIPVKELNSFKKLIKSLNMERKKKQDTKKRVPLSQESGEVGHICTCSNAVQEDNGKNIITRRSCVRIFGRIGVTEDDKYFLNYDARVEDKPDLPIYNEIQQSLSPMFLPVNNEKLLYKNSNLVGCVNGCSKNKTFRNQRDSIIQADFQSQDCSQLPNIIQMPRKESQSTQVNFNIDLTNKKKINTYKKQDPIIQCNCSNIVNNVVAASDSESEHNSLKESHSPLVIISVYPKQDTTDIIKTVNCSHVENLRRPSPQRIRTFVQCSKQWSNDKEGNVSKKNSNKVLKTSRSPSPFERNLSKAKSPDTNINKANVFRANIRNESPGSQTVKTSIKKTPQKERFKQNTNSKKTACFNNTKIPVSKNYGMKRVLPPTRETKSTNTEHLLAKKVLVDNYTKKVTAQLNKKIMKPKNEPSRVTINIDSENEFYDVLFNPGKLSTQLTVRKTVKEMGSQKCYREENLISDERMPRMTCCKQEFCNNQPIDDTENNNHSPRLKVRDSIEINHRREDKVCSSIKNIQTNFSSKRKDLCSEDMEFLAPAKHFTGDNCTIRDPIERDKEIRGLLGVKTNRDSALQIKKPKEQAFENSNQVSMHCFFRKKCDQNLATDFSLNKLCSDNCYGQKKTSKKIQDHKRNKEKESYQKSDSSNHKVDVTNDHDISSEDQRVQENCCARKRRTSGFHWEESKKKHEQLILNRNVQVFLQVEQFSKKKPIILSKKQYEKVKKTIQSTVSNKQEKFKCHSPYRCSQVSVGEVREKVKRNMKSDVEARTDKVGKQNKKYSKDSSKTKSAVKDYEEEQNISMAFISPDDCDAIPKDGKHKVQPRQAVSSVEIRYANVAYTKRVTFSTTNIGAISTSGFAKKNCHSIQTLFRGHKKSATPNLGTSVFSLLSEDGLHSDTKSVKYLMAPEDSKPRKPFLKRLISCLVMRSTRESEPKIPYHAPQEPSADSSIDSYHINTSLGAIEVTSSLYDTSASFYSNHTIQPVNSKMKRGFFSSVRGFLTNRKS